MGMQGDVRVMRGAGRRFAHQLAWMAVGALALLVAWPASADTLTPMRASTLPALQATRLDALLVADGKPLALTDVGARQLDGNQWKSLDLPQDARIAAAFSAGPRAYALLGDAKEVQGVARLRTDAKAIALEGLPPLPQSLSHAQATANDTSVVVAGSAADGHHVFQISPGDEKPTWVDRGAWPASGEATSLAVQTGGIFVTTPSDHGTEALWRWSADGGWKKRSDVPGDVLPSTARAVGQAHILYLLGKGDTAGPATFQTITGSWAPLPGASANHVVAATGWQDGMLWASPASDGTSFAMTSAQIQSSKLLLRWLDWIVIVVYLAAMIGIGLYFYLREKRNSTSSFFVGGRSIPFWAAGVSLYAANTSSISFIAIPAKAFESNWQYLTNNLIAVFGLMFVAVWIVPLLRRLDLMSVFSYLETRFHPAIRMLASALCIVTQIGSRMSVILFLPALAIATITGISVTWSVILMGGFTIIYTAMGGMKAVIWTDFVQVIVKMGGAIFAIGFIVWSLHGGVGEFMHTAMAENKMKLLDFSFDMTKATVWGFIFLVLFDVVLTFPKDQVLMQRTLSTKSDKEAGRSIWAFAAIMIPGGFVFYMIGTALFVFYKAHPERMNPLLPIDATFPLFIAAELPMGVTGLIIAGIFAAAMATLSGIMNSVATLISVDFYDRLTEGTTQKKSVFFAEIMTVIVGLIGIGSALLLSRFDVHSLFDVSIELAGLLGGGFAGAYTLGMFTRRANAQGVAIGIAASIALTLVAWSFKLVHPYFYLAISIMLCIVIGYVASLFFPAPTRSLKGLTIYRDVE